jgi:hypothetical protein
MSLTQEGDSLGNERGGYVVWKPRAVISRHDASSFESPRRRGRREATGFMGRGRSCRRRRGASSSWRAGEGERVGVERAVGVVVVVVMVL